MVNYLNFGHLEILYDFEGVLKLLPTYCSRLKAHYHNLILMLHYTSQSTLSQFDFEVMLHILRYIVTIWFWCYTSHPKIHSHNLILMFLLHALKVHCHILILMLLYTFQSTLSPFDFDVTLHSSRPTIFWCNA